MYETLSENGRLSPKKEICKKMITCFRGIDLDQVEERYLSLGPEFALFEDLSLLKCEKEFLSGMTKI